jgi:hypothetical protein
MFSLNVSVFVFIVLVNVSRAQFYQALNPSSYELNQYVVNDDENMNNQATEKRFVNSGQSIELICDLPNNMPDGKVSSVLFVSAYASFDNFGGFKF